jgi:hypothetical protein
MGRNGRRSLVNSTTTAIVATSENRRLFLKVVHKVLKLPTLRSAFQDELVTRHFTLLDNELSCLENDILLRCVLYDSFLTLGQTETETSV